MDISRGLDVLFTGARRFGCAFKRCGETQPSLRDDSSLEIRSGSVFGLSLADSVVADAAREAARVSIGWCGERAARVERIICYGEER